MATALKLKRDINKLKAAIRSKATPQSYVPKLKAQLQKAEADYESVKAGKKSAPKASKQVKSTLDKLKAIIKKKKYGAYRAQGVDLEKDADRPALRSGKRISKNGNTYYEYRANRIDVKQPPKRYPKLEDGGMMAKGGVIDVVDKYNKLVLPKKVYSNGKIYKGDATFLNGYNGYTSSKDDGYLVDNDGNYLKDEEGRILRSKERRGLTIKFSKGGYMAGGGNTEGKQYAIEIKLEDGEEMAERRKRRNADTRTERVEVYSTPEKAKEAYIKYKNKGEYEGIKIKRIEYVGVYDEDNFKGGGYMADGGGTDMLKEDDMVWNAVGNKLEVYKVTKDEYYLKGFMQPSPMPFSKKKVHNYLKMGEWSLKPKMAEGGTIDNSGMTPADLQKQIWNLTARIAKLGDIESRAASDEIEMLMKQRKKLQSMALNHGDVVMAQGGELHRSQEEKFKYGGYMAEGGVIELKSVGTYFRPSDLATSTDGTFSEDDMFYLSDIDNYEWWHGLSKEDRAKIEEHFDVDKHLMDKFDTKDLDTYHKEAKEFWENKKEMKGGGYMAGGGKSDEENPFVKRWEKVAQDVLLNKKIVKVRYLTNEEQENLGWYRKAVVIQLQDGTLFFPSADDEGNDAGAIFFQSKDNPEGVLPVI